MTVRTTVRVQAIRATASTAAQAAAAAPAAIGDMIAAHRTQKSISTPLRIAPTLRVGAEKVDALRPPTRERRKKHSHAEPVERMNYPGLKSDVSNGVQAFILPSQPSPLGRAGMIHRNEFRGILSIKKFGLVPLTKGAQGDVNHNKRSAKFV